MRRIAVKTLATAGTGLIAVCAGCVGAGRGVATQQAAVTASPTTQNQAADSILPEINLRQVSLTAELSGDALPTTSDPRAQITHAAMALQGPVLSDTLPMADETVPPIAPAAMPLDLGSALEMAAGQNPQVTFARQRIREASAQLQAANALWLPSLRAGVNYNKHEGRLQDVEGVVNDVSRGSLYSGFGAQAVGAGSPAVPGLVMNFHTRDAIFQPRIAERSLAARQQASQAVIQDLLTETAVAYINLLEAQQLRAISRETTVNLQALTDLTASFATSGAGLRSDADRTRTELLIQEVEDVRADENVQLASARLAQLLSYDPTVEFIPQEPSLAPLEMISPDRPLADLIATGLSNRPELAESGFLVGAAVERLRRERYAPLVPSVLLGVSYGWNGGGVGGNLDNFGDRVDADAVAWWEIRNLGFGEQAARESARAQVSQARAQQIRVMDQIASEVVQGHAQLRLRQRQIEIAQNGIGSANDSYRRNAERIRNGQGLPIESLQSVQALGAAQRQYARVVADYNRAQFTLTRSLGWPVSALAAP